MELTAPDRGRRRRARGHGAGARPRAAWLRRHAGLGPDGRGDPRRLGDVEPDHLRVGARGGERPRHHAAAAAGAADRADVLRHRAGRRVRAPTFATRLADAGPVAGPAGAAAAAARGDRAARRQGGGPRSATVEDLEDLARDHDLVVVSTGRGGLASLFPLDAERSPYTSPQRVAALTYLHGVTPDPVRSRAALPLGRGRRRVLHVPGTDRRRAVRHRGRRGRARRAAGLLGRRVDAGRAPRDAAGRARRALPRRGGPDSRTRRWSTTRRCCAAGSPPPYDVRSASCRAAPSCSGWPTSWCSTTR